MPVQRPYGAPAVQRQKAPVAVPVLRASGVRPAAAATGPAAPVQRAQAQGSRGRINAAPPPVVPPVQAKPAPRANLQPALREAPRSNALRMRQQAPIQLFRDGKERELARRKVEMYIDRHDWEKEPRVYIHYTNYAGFMAILMSRRITAGGSGRVYLAPPGQMLSPADVERDLFLGEATHRGKGDYMIVFTSDVVPDVSQLVSSSATSGARELIVNGDVAISRIIWSGRNPF